MRTYKIKQTKPVFGRASFPIDHFLAIYARQSRAEQVEDNPESFQMQTQRLQEIAIDAGWHPDMILPPFIENEQIDGKIKHASATKRMDERPKLNEIVSLIEQNKVKTVLVWLVDRLFRDEDVAEAPAFARICREHGCLVLTSTGDVFDFSDGRDQKRFRQEAEAASEFITYYLKGRALPARRQKALRGEYDGRSVPVGFTVEPKQPKKRFERGTSARYYLVYEPHAEIVRWIFKRYRELSGNFAVLYRELCARPCMFPFYQASEYEPRTTLGENSQGYIMSKQGLKGLLTNVAYIGYWYVDGAPVRKDNHPAIVDEADFWYAFERLSPVTIDGHEKEKAEMIKPVVRYNKVGTIPCNALLNGIITGGTLPDGEEMKVYVIQHAEKANSASYVITDNHRYGETRTHGSIRVKLLDQIFTAYLLERLEKGKEHKESYELSLASVTLLPEEEQADAQEFYEVLAGNDEHAAMARMLIEVAKSKQESTAGIASQIAERTEEAESLDRMLHYGAKALDEKTIETKAARLGKLHREIDQLDAKLKQAAQEQEDAQQFIERLDDVPGAWKSFDVNLKRRFIKLVTSRIVLTKVGRNWLQLAIYWDWAAPVTLCYIWQLRGNSQTWTDEEDRVLRTYYPTADRASLLALLPSRNWDAIMIRAKRLGLSRPYMRSNSGFPAHISIEDQAFMQEHALEYTDPKQRVWWQVAEWDTSYEELPANYTDITQS